MKTDDENIEDKDDVQIDAERIRFRLEYDDNAWRADDPEAELPVLTKIRNWDTEVVLVTEMNFAEDGEDWQEIDRRHFGFGEHNYWVELLPGYGHYEPSVVYIG